MEQLSNANPLFSIVTICFNSEKTIERTIKSVLAQAYQDYEYIIIDGGSHDQTIEIIKRYESSFNGKLTWVSEQDKGIYDAFNKGCRLANGEFIWIVNSDDWIESDALFKLAPIARKHKGDFCILVARMYFHLKDGSKRESPLTTMQRIETCAKKYSMGIAHPASVYSKFVYEEVGLYDDRYYISGDIDHYLRCVRNKKIKFVPINEFITNMSDGGISNVFNFRKVNHDWNIRYKKFSKNRFEYVINILISNYRYIKNYLYLSLKK